MPKVKDTKYEELKKQAEKPTIESSIEILTSRLKEYREKADHFQTLAIKSEGALEVLTQLQAANEDED